VQSAVGWLCGNCGHVASTPAKPTKAATKPKLANATANAKPTETVAQSVPASPPTPPPAPTPDPVEQSSPTQPKPVVPEHQPRRRPRLAKFVAVLILIATVGGALFYFGYYSPALAAWKKYQSRLASSPSAHFAGTIEFKGEQFLSAMNSNLHFSGQYDKSDPKSLKADTKFDGIWGNQRYDGQAALDGSNLYFKIDSANRPVIRYSQSNFLYPVTADWHKTTLDNSLYSNYCETRADFKAPSGLFWVQTARSLKLKTSPIVNPWAKLNGSRAAYFRGTVDTASLAAAIDNLNAALPQGCGLQISGPDIAKAKVTYQFWTGTDFDRFVLRLEDPTLGADATITLQNGSYGKADKVVIPASAVDLNQLRQQQQELLNRDQVRKADVESIKAALTSFYNANRQRYPASLNVLVPRYMPLMPTDPKTKQPYAYTTANSRRSFTLSANLEEPGSGAFTVTGP
jgi:hypothetical protein